MLSSLVLSISFCFMSGLVWSGLWTVVCVHISIGIECPGFSVYVLSHVNELKEYGT
jgi:hypothetical protein